jgi:hypothetical protein
MEFLRHEDYKNLTWKTLIGDIEWGFIDYVKDAGVQMIREVRDPFYGIDLKVSHFGASCHGIAVHKPAGSTTNRGDVADWGGDLMTFYGEWRRDSDSFASGYTYCEERLAKIDGNGTFKLRDLVEDADAYNIAMALRPGVSIADEIARTYQQGGHLTRLRRFWDGRFGGNGTTARAIARDILMPHTDEVINLGRTYLVQSTGGIPTLMPHLLPGDRLNDFCAGFADTLLTRVGQENTRVQRLRAEGKL